MKHSHKHNGADQNGHSGYERFFAHERVTQAIASLLTAESDQSSAQQISDHTRISSRRFARTDVSINMKTTYFTGVNSSGVISSRCLSTPDSNFVAVAELQEGRVFSLDNVNILPTQTNGGQWIGYVDPFIENFNAWSVQNNVIEQSEQQTPRESGQGVRKTVTVKTLKAHSTQEQIPQNCGGDRTTGSKKFTIVHRSILSLKAEVLHV